MSEILISNLLAIPCCKSVLCTKKCAGKANADLLNWVEMETEWKTNNTERMNMTSDQYVHITTDRGLDILFSLRNAHITDFFYRSSKIKIILSCLPDTVNLFHQANNTCFLNFVQGPTLWNTVDHLVSAIFLVLIISTYMCSVHSFFSGGHVVVPKTEKENLDVVAIAEQYYKVLKSNSCYIVL